MSWSASSRRMAGPRPRRCSTACRRSSRAGIDYKGQILEEMDLDALLARRPGPRTRRRTRPHQRAGQPPSQALSRRRGTARRRHRRLHHAQHPARRKPQRRRRADHAHPRARDRAGQHHRPRRRHRGDRPHARGPAAAAARWQGLRRRKPRRARSSIISRPATSPRCANWRCAAPRSGSTRSCSTTCRRTRSPAPGRPATACSSASPAAARATALVRYARRLAERLRAPWTASACRDSSAVCDLSETDRDRIAECLRLAEKLGGEPSPSLERTSPPTSSAMRARTTSRISWSATPDARAGCLACAGASSAN